MAQRITDRFADNPAQVANPALIHFRIRCLQRDIPVQHHTTGIAALPRLLFPLQAGLFQRYFLAFHGTKQGAQITNRLTHQSLLVSTGAAMQQRQ